MSGWLERALRGWRRRHVEEEVGEELTYHLERTEAELRARGYAPQAAGEEARRRFGDVTAYRRELVSIDRRTDAGRRRRLGVAELLEDVGTAARRIRRSPGLAAGIVLTFALGIGANATVFAVVDRLLLSAPTGIAAPDEVARLYVDALIPWVGHRMTSATFTYADYRDLTGVRSFSAVAAYADRPLVVGRGESAERLSGMLASGSYWAALGVHPQLGRFFTPVEDRIGGARVAVLSDGLWRRRFGAERSALGQTVDFGHGPYTIIGVAPRGFTGADLSAVDVWLPLEPAAADLQGTEWREGRGWYWIGVVARLAPGSTRAMAAAEATTVYRNGRREEAEQGRDDPQARVIPGSVIAARGPQASSESKVSLWLAGVSLIVLLVVCANIANLLLARATREQRENGVRLALGISRGRLLRQVLMETLLLGLAGGVAALVVNATGGRLVRGVLLPDVQWTDSLATLRVVAFIALAAALAGLSSGVLPALQASRPDVLAALKSGGRGGSGGRSRLRESLLVLQAALSVVLLAGAGLFVRSLHAVRAADLGIEPRGVMLLSSTFRPATSDDARMDFFRRALERVRVLPGVSSASAPATLPMVMSWAVELKVPGLDSLPRLSTGGPYIQVVDPSYFDVLRLRVVKGRGISAADDRSGAPPIALVNRTMARMLWPGANALGQCLLVSHGGPGAEADVVDASCTTVVGVVENSMRQEIGEAETMQYYLPSRAFPKQVPVGLLVRTRGDDAVLGDRVTRELLSIDPSVRYIRARPFTELLDPQTRSWRLGAAMFTLFGILAAVVAAVGLYGVLAFSVAQRRRELGIRAALGADRRRLISVVLRHALGVTAAGVALGLIAVVIIAPRIQDLLYHVSPRDPLVLGAVPILLLMVALLAALRPAWQAMRVDPNAALRED